jgi:hypothetical protein
MQPKIIDVWLEKKFGKLEKKNLSIKIITKENQQLKKISFIIVKKVK